MYIAEFAACLYVDNKIVLLFICEYKPQPIVKKQLNFKTVIT